MADATFTLAAAGLDGLSHISLETRDLDRALAFYVRTFGFEPIWDRVLEGAAFERIIASPGARSRFVRGRLASGTVLQLWQHEWREARDSHTTLLSFEVRDAHAAHAALQQDGIPCVSEPVAFDGSIAFVILDPDMHSIEIIQWEPDAIP